VPRDPRRHALVDLVGLLALLLALADYLPPALLLLPTLTAGGDTPCHYPTLAFLVEKLLPVGRLHGWYPGAYLGHPLLLYYFPLPFLLMAALAPLVGLPVAFKLGTVGGVFLLPLAAWAALRLLGFRFPAPLLGLRGSSPTPTAPGSPSSASGSPGTRSATAAARGRPAWRSR
jgi:uncharacterized membrane protein